MSKIEERVEKLLKERVENIGYELYDVLYLKEGKNNILRIVIDNDSEISLNDCEKVNNEITDVLDEADYIKESYYLEVSSTGIERLLRKTWQLEKNVGEDVEVKLFKKDENGFKEYVGKLNDVTDKTIELSFDDGERYVINRESIAQIKTIYKEERMIDNESNR